MSNEYRPPKWVMCGVCGEVIYGGPTKFGVPRVCGGKVENPNYNPNDIGSLKWHPCIATAVYSGKGGKVVVKWDKDFYAAHAPGVEGPEIEYADGKLPDMSQVGVEQVTLDDVVEGHLTDMYGTGGYNP